MNEFVLVVLSGEVVNSNGLYELGYYMRSRLDAALKLWDIYKCKIILSGGLVELGHKDKVPTYTELMRKYLLNQNELISNSIIYCEDKSENTFEQLRNVLGYLKCDDRDVHIMSNYWHLPRIASFLVCEPSLRVVASNKVKLIPVEVELTCADVSTEILDNEVRGIKAIMSRNYNYKRYEEHGVNNFNMSMEEQFNA